MARYEYVDSQNNEPGNTNPVVKTCRWLQVSTSGFYHWWAAHNRPLRCGVRH